MNEGSLRFGTVGHSTRIEEEFLELLRRHGVTVLVDVRHHPGSRRHPHFDSEALAASLREARIGYRHEGRLGGRRDPEVPREESENAGWESESFRAYADHLNRETGKVVAGHRIVYPPPSEEQGSLF